MKKFLKNILRFIIPLFFLFISGIFLPTTPRASKSLLFADKIKDSLLIYTNAPRIIFVGGSNLSFGLDSKMLKDSLTINPINLGLHANLGLKYMLENTLLYLKPSDTVILALEYSHFFKEYDGTSEELFRLIYDVNFDKIQFLSLKQKILILRYLPKYSLSKYKFSEYFNYYESDIYSVNSFNKFGDVDTHYNLANRDFIRDDFNNVFNQRIIYKLKEFERKSNELGVSVYVTFPPFDAISFEKGRDRILLVEKELINNNFNVLGSPCMFKMDSKYMFNTDYHLNKGGVDLRTYLLMKQIKNIKSSERKHIIQAPLPLSSKNGKNCK